MTPTTFMAKNRPQVTAGFSNNRPKVSQSLDVEGGTGTKNSSAGEHELCAEVAGFRKRKVRAEHVVCHCNKGSLELLRFNCSSPGPSTNTKEEGRLNKCGKKQSLVSRAGNWWGQDFPAVFAKCLPGCSNPSLNLSTQAAINMQKPSEVFVGCDKTEPGSCPY